MRTPGEQIQAQLRRRGLTQTELAHQLGRPVSTVNDLAHDRLAITARMALQLEAAFDVPALEWLTCQAEYQLRLARADAKLRARAARSGRR